MSERDPHQEYENGEDNDEIERIEDLIDFDALDTPAKDVGAIPGSGLDLDDLDDIDDLDDLDDLDDISDLEDGLLDPVSEARRRLSVDELIDRLVRDVDKGTADEITLGDTFVLSDLSRAEMQTVESHWLLIPVERRRLLVSELVQSAEDVLELQLGRLLRIPLRDPDDEVRMHAISGLWDDGESDLIGPYIQMMNRPGNVALRSAAAAALGTFVLQGELDELDSALAMRVEQALLEVLQNNEEPVLLRARALESIAYSSEAGLRQLLQDAYYSTEEEMRLSAVRAMGRSADSRWRSMVRAELTSPEPAMRAEAARASGELEVKAALPQIMGMVEDPESIVRLAAIEALGRLGGKAARDLLRAIANEEDVIEAEAAEAALDEILFWDEQSALSALGGEDDDDDVVEGDDDGDEGDDDGGDLDNVDPWRRNPSQPWDE